MLNHRDPFSVVKIVSLDGLRVTLDTTCIPSALFLAKIFLCLDGLRATLDTTCIPSALFRCQDFFCLDGLHVTFDTTFIPIRLFPLLPCPFLFASFLVQVRVGLGSSYKSTVRYHSGGSMKLNARILHLVYMVYL